MAAATINGVEVADIASLNGVAIADIASFNGIEVSGGPPPAESDALVADAGTVAADGTYTYTGTHNGKRYYNLSGTSATVSAISWDGTDWVIYGSGGENYYDNDAEDVTYPWESAVWTRNAGANDPPTVTEV